MSDEVSQMARFLVVCTIALGAAEYITRRSVGAPVRWAILAAIWVIVVFMLFWTLGL